MFLKNLKNSILHKLMLINARFRLQNRLRFLGIQVSFVPVSSDLNSPYEVIIPSSTYAPWRADENFKKIFLVIEPYTLLSIYRAYQLFEICKQIIAIDGDCIEVGAYRGGSAKLIAMTLNNLGSSKLLNVYDTFEGVAKASTEDVFYSGGEHSSTSLSFVRALLSDYAPNVNLVQGIFPQSEARNYKISLAHIDVDSYTSAKESFEFIWPKLEKGGVIIFDDYGDAVASGVTKYVNEIKNTSSSRFIHNLNGQGIFIKY